MADSFGGWSIQGLALAVPDRRIDQSDAADFAQARCAHNDEQRRRLQTLYRRSTVQSRGSVLFEHVNGNGEEPASTGGADAVIPATSAAFSEFYPPRSSCEAGPSVDQRMQRYADQALPLVEQAASRALEDGEVSADEIGQLVVVSCTGFTAPGVDVRLIDKLGLEPTVGRTMIGFMGCHGAINGMRVAQGLALAQPEKSVLMCCVELCSLHFQYGWDMQRVVANALFADGAGAVVGKTQVNAARSQAPTPNPLVRKTGSMLVPDSTEAMTWRIGAHGFEMTLSAEVPDLIEAHLRAWIEPWLGEGGLGMEDVAGWAIHPGGPKVITAVERALTLPDGAGDASRAVLGELGNMSSPTVLFILDRLREAGVRGPCLALAFGPGLMAEAALVEL